MFSVVSSIPACPALAKIHLPHASELMNYFLVKAGELYGSEFLVYNVHSFIHLVDDVAQYGSLDQFSSFPFESYLQKLKKFVCSGKSPFAQIVK